MSHRQMSPHRAFLDANILYAASIGGGCAKLWSLPEVELVTSEYAAREAWECLGYEANPQAQRDRLAELLNHLELVPHKPTSSPSAWELPDPTDVPILEAAIDAQCTHLLTADKKCFGQYFGHHLGGVLVMQVGKFLAMLGH